MFAVVWEARLGGPGLIPPTGMAYIKGKEREGGKFESRERGRRKGKECFTCSFLTPLEMKVRNKSGGVIRSSWLVYSPTISDQNG